MIDLKKTILKNLENQRISINSTEYKVYKENAMHCSLRLFKVRKNTLNWKLVNLYLLIF